MFSNQELLNCRSTHVLLGRYGARTYCHNPSFWVLPRYFQQLMQRQCHKNMAWPNGFVRMCAGWCSPAMCNTQKIPLAMLLEEIIFDIHMFGARPYFWHICHVYCSFVILKECAVECWCLSSRNDSLFDSFFH